MRGLALTLLLAAVGCHADPPAPAPASGVLQPAVVDSGGRPRHYAAFLPSALRPGAAVLLALHPSQSVGADMRRIVGPVFERLAGQQNLIVVYPDGIDGHFNDCRRAASYRARTLAIDDVGFSRRIVAQLAEKHLADATRVFAIGYSNGGQMALRLALEAPDLVVGVASIAANLPAPDNLDCRVQHPPARRIAFVTGTRDPINPYDGGRVSLFGFGSRGEVLSAQASALWFVQALSLPATPVQSQFSLQGVQVEQQDWASASARVRLVSIDGGGHTVPQAHHPFLPLLGSTLRSDTVLEATWQWLAEDRR